MRAAGLPGGAIRVGALGAGLLVGALGAGRAAAAPAVPLGADGGAAWQVGAWTGFADAVAPLGLEGAVALPWPAAAGAGGPPRPALLRPGPLRPGPLALVAGLTVPTLGLDLRDRRVDLGAELPLLAGPWDLRAAAGLRAVSTENDALEATALGTTLGISGGRRGPRWAAGAELRAWMAWATHLRTTAYAEEVGGALPYRGWAPRSAAHLQAGLRGGGLVGPVELGLRAGYQTRGELNLVIPPIYAELSLGLRR